jgi:[acyl-carrier-protein] S-malonyltransferase
MTSSADTAAGTGAAGRTALVFPGMSALKYADVARFMLTNPIARRLREEADDALGYCLADHYRDAEEDYAESAQAAFLLNCTALAQWAVGAFGFTPVACAGPSFGAKAAACFSGALGFADTIRLTVELARCEQDYFRTEHTDVVTQSFVRTPEEGLRELLAGMDARGQWYEVSCHVDRDFFMVSLREPGLDAFTAGIRALGGLPLYAMRPPMHCAAFAPLRERAAAVLDGFTFADPALPVVRDQDGAAVTTAAGVREMLLDGFVRPVRWPDAVRGLRDLAVTRVCVAGPDTLWGRVPCTVEAFDVLAASPRAALRPRRYAPWAPPAPVTALAPVSAAASVKG